MMNWLKKVLSLLIAIALLVSTGALALAEEVEPIEPAAEEIVQPAGEEAPAQTVDTAAEDAAAQQAAAEAAAQQAAAEAAAQQAAAEAAAAEAAAQQAAAEAAAQEAEPVPSYNNSEDTSDVTDVPAANDEPAVIDAPVVNDEPAAGNEPAVNDEPTVNNEPTVNDEPAANDEPAVNDEPAANDEPAVNDGPAVNDEPGANEEPAVNDEPDTNGTPADSDTSADGEVPAADGDASDTVEPAAGDEPAEGDDVDDPNDPTIIFIDDDDRGHTDDETVKELGLEMTDDIVFADAIPLSLNAPASAGIDAENRAEFLFTAESDMTIVLGLEASSEAVDVRINGDAVYFTKIAGTEYDGGLNALCELNLTAGKYDIILTSSYNVYVTLTAMDPATAQAKVDAIAAAKAEANTVTEVVSNEESSENTAAENEENTDTDSDLEGNVNDGNEINTDENTTEEEVIPPMVGWITVDAESYGIGSTITLTAASESELGEMVAWQTKVGEGDWQGAGYGSTLTVELNEENNNSSFRFRMEDGNYSSEYTLTAAEEQAEEAEVTEESEDTEEAAEETEEAKEVTDETEETEETAEEADEAEEAEGTEEETDEAEEAEETEEEVTEEAEETEENEEEKMAALGCVKVVVTAEEGADLYAEADKESEVVGHLDAETEIWAILNEDGTWAKIYSEDEEAAAQFISMEDAKIAGAEEETEEETEETEETEEEALTDEELIELGYRKVQVLNKNGVDVYAGTEEDAEAIGHIDFEEELWIKDAEAEGWAEIYNEEEEVKFVKLDELDKQPLTDEEMLKLGYYKVMVILEIGADTYRMPDEKSEIVSHLDNGTELWVKPMEDNLWAEIFTEDEEVLYVYLADMAATQTPEDAIELPIRKITVTSTLDNVVVATLHQEVELVATLENFLEDDNYVCVWQYTPDRGETFIDIEGATELTYLYSLEIDNLEYGWRIVIKLLPKE